MASNSASISTGEMSSGTESASDCEGGGSQAIVAVGGCERSPRYFVKKRKEITPLCLNHAKQDVPYGVIRMEYQDDVLEYSGFGDEMKYFVNLDRFPREIFDTPWKTVGRYRGRAAPHLVIKSKKGKSSGDIPGDRFLRGNYCAPGKFFAFLSLQKI